MLNKLTTYRKQSEQGFTLIELLVVIIIIGILAAIAIPIFMNQQKAAIQAGMKSDVHNTNVAVQEFLIKHPTAGKDLIQNREGEDSIPEAAVDANTIDIIRTHPDTRIVIYGRDGWKGYVIRAWNPTIDPDASFEVAGEHDVYYRSTTGKITIGG